MKAIIGIDSTGAPIAWEPELLTNPHLLITGMSGSGKTHLLRTIIHQLVNTAQSPVRVHVIDIHEDINIPGASSLLFSQNMPYGFNPLVVDSDIHSGGINPAITSFLKLLSRTANYKIGDRQEAVLRSILTEVYESNGFYVDNPNSWRLDDGRARQYPKKYPTLGDAYKYANFKLQQLFLGASPKALAALRELSNKQKSFMRQVRQARVNGQRIDQSEDTLQALDKLREAMNDYCDTALQGDGKELDNLLRYPTKDLLAGIVDRLSKLHFMGVFSGETPPFDPNVPVWRYCLKQLHRDESILFVHTLAENIFRNAKKRGVTNTIRDIIVLDEAKRFQDGDSDSIFDTIAVEARKFGLALISSSQSHSHFTADAIRASATGIVLRQDDSDFQRVRAVTNIAVSDLANVRPRKSALVKMTGHPRLGGHYIHIMTDTKEVAAKLNINPRMLAPNSDQSTQAAFENSYGHSTHDGRKRSFDIPLPDIRTQNIDLALQASMSQHEPNSSMTTSDVAEPAKPTHLQNASSKKLFF